MSDVPFWLAFVLIGWPAILVSLCLIVLGIRRSGPRVALAGALLATPFLLYAAAGPRFRYVSPLVLLLCYTIPVALAHRRRVIALVCATPYVAFVVAFAWLVIGSHAGR